MCVLQKLPICSGESVHFSGSRSLTSDHAHSFPPHGPEKSGLSQKHVRDDRKSSAFAVHIWFKPTPIYCPVPCHLCICRMNGGSERVKLIGDCDLDPNPKLYVQHVIEMVASSLLPLPLQLLSIKSPITRPVPPPDPKPHPTHHNASKESTISRRRHRWPFASARKCCEGHLRLGRKPGEQERRDCRHFLCCKRDIATIFRSFVLMTGIRPVLLSYTAAGARFCSHRKDSRCADE